MADRFEQADREAEQHEVVGRGDEEMNAAEIAVALGGARRNGRGWLCKCPAHHDRTPSLSIDDGDRVPIVVKCFAGCDSREVLAELRRLGLPADEADRRDDHRGDRRPYRTIQPVQRDLQGQRRARSTASCALPAGPRERWQKPIWHRAGWTCP